MNKNIKLHHNTIGTITEMELWDGRLLIVTRALRQLLCTHDWYHMHNPTTLHYTNSRCILCGEDRYLPRRGTKNRLRLPILGLISLVTCLLTYFILYL